MKRASICLCMFFVFCLLGTAGSVETITTSGSSTVHEIVHEASALFSKSNPDVKFVVGTGSSKKGIQAVGKGEVAIGQSGRLPKKKEQKKYPDLVSFKIAMDGVAIIVNTSNPVSKITKEQLQYIYTGKITNWKDIGGNDAPIELVSKELGRSAQEMFLKYCDLEAVDTSQGRNKQISYKTKQGTLSGATCKVVGPNNQAIALISTRKNAIAYVSLGFAQFVAQKGGKVKLLELDGIVPTAANISNETYPMRRALYVITKGQPEGNPKKFIDFLLGDEGQSVVESLHYLRVI